MKQVYELPKGQFIPSHEAKTATEFLINLKDKFGIPVDLTAEDMNDTSWKFVQQIIKVWISLYPHSAQEWKEHTNNKLKYERPVWEAIHKGGYFPIAYPEKLAAMFQILIPKVKIQKPAFYEPFLQLFPAFKTTNYKVGKTGKR